MNLLKYVCKRKNERMKEKERIINNNDVQEKEMIAGIEDHFDKCIKELEERKRILLEQVSINFSEQSMHNNY